jgi:hypothetical protein
LGERRRRFRSALLVVRALMDRRTHFLGPILTLIAQAADFLVMSKTWAIERLADWIGEGEAVFFDTFGGGRLVPESDTAHPSRRSRAGDEPTRTPATSGTHRLPSPGPHSGFFRGK